VVGGIVGERQPPLTPPYQGGESFSSPVVSPRIMESSLRMTHSALFTPSKSRYPWENGVHTPRLVTHHLSLVTAFIDSPFWRCGGRSRYQAAAW
jgi:hypothetical protein